MFRDASPPSSAAGCSLGERGEASFCGELGSGGAAGQALVGGQGLGDDRVHVVVAVGGEAAGKGDAWFSVGEGLVAFSGRGTGYWGSPSAEGYSLQRLVRGWSWPVRCLNSVMRVYGTVGSG